MSFQAHGTSSVGRADAKIVESRRTGRNEGISPGSQAKTTEHSNRNYRSTKVKGMGNREKDQPRDKNERIPGMNASSLETSIRETDAPDDQREERKRKKERKRRKEVPSSRQPLSRCGKRTTLP
jgi:hypothetical protein